MNRMLTMTAACVLAAGLATRAAAQDYPTQTIKVISSFGAGGGSDIIARILAQRMQEKFGRGAAGIDGEIVETHERCALPESKARFDFTGGEIDIVQSDCAAQA